MKQTPLVDVADFGAAARNVGRVGVGCYMVPGRRGRNEVNFVKTISHIDLEFPTFTLDLKVNDCAVSIVTVTTDIQLDMLINV